MDGGKLRFVSLADAVAALHATSEPMALTRFEPVVAERVVIAVNAATAADRASPVPGEHPDGTAMSRRMSKSIICTGN
jgi:hypothetical protein